MSEIEQEPDLSEEEVAQIDAEPDETEDDGDVQEPDLAAASALDEPEQESGAMMEKMGKSLDALQKHVAKRIGDIFGDAANLFEECEVCSFWNTPGWRMTGPLPEAVESAMRTALGSHAAADYKPDEYSRVCEKCNGLGVVLTGSKVLGQESITCLACKGMGWVPVGTERASGAFVTVNGPGAAPPSPVAPAKPAAPESPEIAAARELLQHAGHMVIAPFTPA